MAELRRYGIATTIVFPLLSYTSTRADFSTGDPVFAAGDFTIIKDESTAVNCNSTGVYIGKGIFRLALSSSETNAARIVVIALDSTGKGWEDQAIIIETYGSTLGQHSVNLGSSDGLIPALVSSIGMGIITSTAFASGALSTENVGGGVFTKMKLQVTDALAVDTYGESTGVPSATDTIERKLAWMQTLARNEIWQNSTSQFLRGDTGGALASASVSLSTSVVANSTSLVRGEFA